MESGAYKLSAQLPGKHGRHLIYAIWQRSDSPEAFYSCSDVVFSGSPSVSPSAFVEASPTTEVVVSAPAAEVRASTGNEISAWRYWLLGFILLATGLVFAWYAIERFAGRHRA